MTQEGQPQPQKGWFETTRWSLVLAAGDRRRPDRDEALSSLCRDYWPPVFSYVCSRGYPADSARDLTQGFFTRLLEKNVLQRAQQVRGRFRSFLLSSVKNYLANEWDRDQALKRGGGTVRVPLDFDTTDGHNVIEPAGGETPDQVFEKRYALTVLNRALERLGQEAQEAGTAERFRRLKPFLTAEGEEDSYGAVASELDMSVGAVKVAVHRLRKRFGHCLRAEVAQTVNDDDAVDAELRYLQTILSG
jgi:RNA polymerase sigma-70 factor (ECF subfamily)